MASSPPPSPLSAAPWLELFDSPHGLGLRVTRDAPAGTALLMERPLAAVTSVGRSRESSRPRPRPRRRCRRCLSLLSLRPPSRLRTCGGCKDSSYCDSDCEEEDKDAHVFSGECELLRRAAEKMDKEKEREKDAFLPLLREACLALRLLRARPPSAGPLVTHSEELMGGAESGERGRRVWAAAELAARALEAALSSGASGNGGGGSDADTSHPPPPPPLPFEAFHRAASAALCAAIVNSLELRFCDEDEAAGRLDEQKDARVQKGKDEDEEDEEDSGLPLAVFAFAARANHSCRPSASFSTRSKGKISLRALRDLRKGEEVTICYLAGGGGDGAAMLPLARRRRALLRARCFRCECERCLLEETLMGEEEEEGGEGPEASGGDNGAKGAQAETTAETAAATAAATRAVLSFLGPCLSAERLLARGETAAIEEGGNAWSAAARALVEAAGEALLRGGSGKGGGGARSSEGNTAAARATAAATTTAAPFSFAGPPPLSQLFRSARAAAEVCLEATGGEPNSSLLRLIGKIPTTTAPAVATTTAAAAEEEEEQEKELETLLRGAAQGSNGDAQSALSLASAAAHASARAAALLGAALGRAHPAAERARFSAFGGGRGRGDGRGSNTTDEERCAAALPFRVASQVVRLAASLERRQLVGGGGTVN